VVLDLPAAEYRDRMNPAETTTQVLARDATIRAAVAKAGRNDQCPCGSGRKVKHCHGRRAHSTESHWMDDSGSAYVPR